MIRPWGILCSKPFLHLHPTTTPANNRYAKHITQSISQSSSLDRSITGTGIVPPCSRSTLFNKLPCANLLGSFKSTIGPFLARLPSITPLPLSPLPHPDCPCEPASSPSPVNAL